MRRVLIRFIALAALAAPATGQTESDSAVCARARENPQAARVACTRIIETSTTPMAERATAFGYRGMTGLSLGQPDAALADLDQSLSIRPDSAQFLNARAAAFTALRQFDHAIADLNRALVLQPDFVMALGNRATVRTMLGQANAALVDLDRALMLAPTDASIWNLRGVAHARSGNSDQAIADYTRAITLDPSNAQTYHNRGSAFHMAGRLEQAIEDLSAALRIDPEDASTWDERGLVHATAGNHASAIADFDRAIELGPTRANAWAHRGNLRSRLRQFDMALRDVDEALRLDPTNATAHFARGHALAHLGRHAEALASLDRAIELGSSVINMRFGGRPPTVSGGVANAPIEFRFPPNLNEAYELRGHVHLALGNTNAAMRDFNRLINSGVRDARGWLGRGILHARAGRMAEAIPDLEAALRIAPNSAAAHYWLGFALYSSRQYERALRSLNESLRIDQDHIDAVMTRGAAFAALGRFHSALEDLERVRASRPDDTTAQLFLGNVQIRLHRWAEAEATYDAAIQLDRSAPAGWVGRAFARSGRGNHAGALEDVAVALEISPNEIDALLARCWIRIGLAQFDDALRDCDLVNPNDPRRSMHALVLLHLNRVDEARTELEAALAANPRDPVSRFGRALARARQGDRDGAALDIAVARVEDPRVDETMARIGFRAP